MHRVCLALLVGCQLSAAPFHVDVQKAQDNLRLTWPGSLVSTSGATVYPTFQVEQSPNLRNWSVIADGLKAAGPNLEFLVPHTSPHAYFRVLAQWQSQAYALAQGGAEVFGYTKAFERELERLGQLSVANFAAMYPAPNHLHRINWEPTNSIYWNLFATDPAINNVGLSP